MLRVVFLKDHDIPHTKGPPKSYVPLLELHEQVEQCDEQCELLETRTHTDTMGV
jgi:hypothetical protein